MKSRKAKPLNPQACKTLEHQNRCNYLGEEVLNCWKADISYLYLVLLNIKRIG